MNCRRVEQLLSNHLEGRLPARAAGEVRAHLGSCAACRRLRDELLEVGADLRALVEPIPPPYVERRAVVRWIAEQVSFQPSGWRRTFARVPHPPAWRRPLGFPAMVAALLLAVLGLALVRWARGPAVGPPPLRIAAGGPADPGTPAPHSASRPSRAEDGSHRAAAPGVRPSASSKSTPTYWAPRADGPRERVGSDPPPFLRSRRRPPTVGDLADMNREPASAARQWATRWRDELDQIEATLRRSARVGDDFVHVPFPRLASASDRQIAQAVESYRREAAIVDARLARAVTVQQKGTALSDLCERLRSDTGIDLAAGQSVADEKVSVFCEKLPLRDAMRQLSRPFGYTWIRSGKTGEYRYELVQDLRSQLLEEELRNRDRNEALLALDRDVERYRPYLSLSADEALARAKTASPAEKPLLEHLAGCGWGPIHTYFRLSPHQLAALRAGQWMTFSEEPRPGQQPLPREIARGVLQSRRVWRAVKNDDGWGFTQDATDPRGVPLSSVPEMRAFHLLHIGQADLGYFTLEGDAGFFVSGSIGGIQNGEAPYAVGRSRAVLEPENRVTNAKLARDPALRRRVTVLPSPFCGPSGDPSLGAPPLWRHAGGTPAPPGKGEPLPLSVSGRGSGGGVNKVTTADVLEALHRASGMPLVADYYTRLYPLDTVSVRNQPLFDALNHLADAVGSRWNRDQEAGWLQFRSVSYYDDRLKEVPNRLLARWMAARRQHGMLMLDHLVEIAQLSDAQLDVAEMAEGADACYGLEEWDLARNYMVRPHLRYLAGFTPAQRQEMMSPAGLPFVRMSLGQQQEFLAHALFDDAEPLQSLEEMSGATLRVDYSQPGWFQWASPGPPWLRWVVPVELGPTGRRVPRAPVRERTREAALQAARGIEPRVQEMMLQIARGADPRIDAAQMVPRESQIVSTHLDLRFIYIPGTSNRRPIHVLRPFNTEYYGTGG